MYVKVQKLPNLVVRAGHGDHVAFRRLYALLAPPMLSVVSGNVPDRDQAMNVVRSTFIEVWRMAERDARVGTIRRDVVAWVEGIALLRSVERWQALDLIARELPTVQVALRMAEFIDGQDRSTRRQFATVFNGQDIPARPRGQAGPRGGGRVRRRRIVRLSTSGRLAGNQVPWPIPAQRHPLNRVARLDRDHAAGVEVEASGNSRSSGYGTSPVRSRGDRAF